ncbi:MAG: hypothetical protein JXM70_29130, partial [Pirellulales bacterium]|nr:hypothetical protein [Pirellulales bacterium]
MSAAALLISIHAAMSCLAATVSSFTIRTDLFDRGNVISCAQGKQYADKHPCIYNGGKKPNATQYDLLFPVTADYTIAGLYAARNSRPVDIYLDGKKIHSGFASTTGSWMTSTAKWETQCKVRITKGRHTIKLQGPMFCHICALRFKSSVAFPDDWKLERSIAHTLHIPHERERDIDKPYHLIPEHPFLVKGRRELKFEVLPTDELKRVFPPHNDELTLPRIRIPSTPWVAVLNNPAHNLNIQSPIIVGLVPDKLTKTLRSISEMISDFRTQDGVTSGFLEKQNSYANELAKQWKQVEKLPDGRAKWSSFCRLYVEAARLEYDVALQNPLMNFAELLLIRRGEKTPFLGLPNNFHSNCSLPRRSYDDEIDVLSPVSLAGKPRRLYRPNDSHFVGDVDLDYDAGKMLFSSIGTHDRWHIFEINTDGSGLRQLTPHDLDDVDHYDGCYLPNGDIIFASTAPMAAVPCVNGSAKIANLYRMNADGQGIRQLCFDQEHNWCPTVLPNGRVMYLRWEYTDTPHSHDRVLFHMNPDGTGQMEYYGSNSYWPNSNFYARPIPQHPNKFVGIVGGHHGVRRMGELVIFDVTKGRRESSGAVQRIPGRGKPVEAIIADNLVDNSWPKFLHPYPLSDKYFLVSAKPTPTSSWGIYLADVNDHMVLLQEKKGYALFEPVPLRKTPRPPIVPD